MNKIIIPTDFSEGAWHATEYGLRLAKELKAEVVLIHAFHEPKSGASNLVSIVDLMRKDAENEMYQQRLKIERLELDKDLRIEYLSVHGDLINVLENHVWTDGKQLVVMGTQGATGIRKFVLGTNTSAALKHLDAPIFAIPPGVDFGFENGISCGIDESISISDEDFKWLKSIINLSPSKKIELINVLTASDMSEENMTEIPEQFNGIDFEFTELVNENAIDGLDQYIQNSSTDCLVLIKRNLNFFEKLVKRSTSMNLVTISKCPLLIIRSRK